jgi:hypothetical protein
VELVTWLVQVFAHTGCVNDDVSTEVAPPHIIKACRGVEVCLQAFLTLEPDEDECLAALLLWTAAPVHSWLQSWSCNALEKRL